MEDNSTTELNETISFCPDHQNNMHVWTVAWMNSDYGEPTVTVFSNWEAASKYYHWCKDNGYDCLCMDECPVYNQIIIDDILVGLSYEGNL